MATTTALCRRCQRMQPHRIRKDRQAHVTPCCECERTANRLRRRQSYAQDSQHILSVNKRWHDKVKSPEQIKKWSYLTRYKLTLDDFYAMVEDQDGRCASCRDILDMGKHTHVDHCHQSHKVRGILCGPCNKALGFLHDDPVRVMALLQYIGEKYV